MSGCNGQTEEPQAPSDEQTYAATEAIVLVTDSDEWRVRLFHEHMLYAEAAAVELPAPWIVPTREDAQTLKTLTYGDGKERYITSDGYTFGMPSSSVTKAGSKTKYSVLGLHRRTTTIVIEW